MRPISPNTGAPEIHIAEDQPEYMTLPAAVYHNSAFDSPQILTRYKLSPEERKAVAEGADIFVAVLTFGKPYPPMTVQVGPQHFQLDATLEDQLSPDDRQELADFKEGVSTGLCPYCKQPIVPPKKDPRTPNPYEKDGKWYFFDETEDSHGPFDTKEIANKALGEYCDWLENGDKKE